MNVVEVAHDFQQQIKNYVTNYLKLLNSYDTWHGQYIYYCLSKFYMAVKFTFYAGTKNVAKALSKLVHGKGNESVKAELVDKSKCRTIIELCV